MTSFDRIRPRTPDAPAAPAAPGDPDGKRALFSTEPAIPAIGAVTLTCPGCGQATVLGLRQAARVLAAGAHLVLPGRIRSYLRCPGCAERRWLRVSVRL